MVRPTLESPPLAASEETKVGAQAMSVGVLGSYGGSAGRPFLLPGWFQLPGQVRDMIHT